MVPDVVFTVAVIVGVPNATPVTTPVLLTVARVVSLELHATWFVNGCVLLSSNVPVAVRGVVEPAATVGLLGVIVSEVRATVLTMTPLLAETPSCEAVIVVFPAASAVTRPALTEAKVGEEVVHLADAVTSLLSPFTVFPLAVNCSVSPTFRKMDVGVRAMLFRALPETKKLPHALLNRAKVRMRTRLTQELRPA